MDKQKVADLVKAHALLASCGLERTLTTLIAEAAQLGKDSKTVQKFLETVIAQNNDEENKVKKGEKADLKKESPSSHAPKRGETANGPNVPFCRIKPEDVVYADDRLKDNRYVSKGGVDNDFGYKAHMDLIVTRGKGFTKEKNKKKRGSYSGGKITMQSHSIKFE
ncbi:jun-like transcription factor [Coemansia sp. RSA 2598]|nr:jun-like transcription factor [Coemansia sp. RSA 2598]